jgi:putative ABC transport system substrate-binding protein
VLHEVVAAFLATSSSITDLQAGARTLGLQLFVVDASASGIVPRLSGNTTGLGILEASLVGKWLELLSEIAPGLKRVAIMFNPDINPVSSYFMPSSFETAARSLKVEAITAPVHDDVEVETAITALGREPGGSLVVTADAFVLSYGPDSIDNLRRAASYVDRIARGEAGRSPGAVSDKI